MILIKNKKEIGVITEGGKILSRVMDSLGKMVKPGITTRELDEAAQDLILRLGGDCSFKDYQGFPACLCTSVNQEIVHFVPSSKVILKEGDIISLDLGVFYKGFHTDMAVTLPVGKISKEANKLIKVTKKSLEKAIKEIKPGKKFGNIGYVIQKYVEGQGLSVVRDLCGHGIGKTIHEDPQILNYGKKGTGVELKEGMVFCIEPMITNGGWRIKRSEGDDFGYETADGSLSAHFEHTILVTKNGSKALTH